MILNYSIIIGLNTTIIHVLFHWYVVTFEIVVKRSQLIFQLTSLYVFEQVFHCNRFSLSGAKFTSLCNLAWWKVQRSKTVIYRDIGPHM